jgi:glycosyltransferase involved in cell wall biosynthesis
MIRDSWGGSEELWADMAKVALQNNHTVIHLAYEFKPLHPKMQELINKGLIYYTRPSYKRKFNKSLLEIIHKSFFFIKKRTNNSVRKIFEHNPNLVLYNGTCYSIAEEKKLLHYWGKAGINFFILGHFNNDKGENLSPSAIEAIKQAYHKSKQVFFVAARSIQTAKRELNTDIPNALVIRNPVNIRSTEIIAWPTNIVTQFAMVGNLIVRHKGQDIALEVLCGQEWEQRNWHLNIYGSGEDEGYLKNLVEFRGLQNRVTFHGRVSDIREVWSKNEVLLMPSLMEGMPLAVVEAMICGRPVVVTDVGGHKEWVDDGRQGFIADAADISSFGDALERAWSEKNNWQQIGISAHKKAMELYDPEPGKTLLQLITT